MTAKSKQLPDEIFFEALRLQDEGRQERDILERFAPYEAELKELFAVAADVQSRGERILPRPAFLEKLIKTVAAEEYPVTKPAEPRYIHQKVTKQGRAFKPLSFLELINSMISKKAVILVAVFVLLLVAVVIGRSGRREERGPVSHTPNAQTQTAANPIDATLNALLADNNDEAALSAAGEQDAGLVTEDSDILKEMREEL